MNQPQVYVCPRPLEASSHLPPPPETSLNRIVTTEKLYTELLTLECELAD